ncbi:MAG: serine/threonine protein kinase, partial [Acidobacteria bacterium]
ARMMAKIRHPNVVSVFDVGLVDDRLPCIAMELLDGEPLSDRLYKRRALPWPEAVEIILGILAGLGAIHAADVLHRDLKPSNVIVCHGEPEIVKLIDFGIAKAAGADALKLTRTGVVVGTPAYMAPEYLSGKPCGPRSDLYAAALILYEMIAGQLPFHELGTAGIWARLERPVPPVSAPEDGEPVPPALVEVLRVGLDADPDKRAADAKSLARQLRRVLAGRPPEDATAGRPAAAAPATEAGTAAAIPTTAATVLDAGAPPATAAASTFLVAARLPPSRLADPGERRWLADLARQAGRGFSFGSQYWFAVQTAGSDGQAANRAGAMVSQLAQRYGATARLTWRLAGPDFGLSAATLSGGAPLPAELQGMLEELSR